MSVVKCRFCKKEITKEGAYSIQQGQYYCNEEHYDLQRNKIKYKAPKTKADGEPNDRRLLTDYIQEIFVDGGWDKHDINWTLMTAQIKNIQKENPNLTYNWIRYCLWYMRVIKNQNFFDENFNGSILNLVPFVYLEAYNYWKETKELKSKTEQFNLDENRVIVKQHKKGKVKKFDDL